MEAPAPRDAGAREERASALLDQLRNADLAGASIRRLLGGAGIGRVLLLLFFPVVLLLLFLVVLLLDLVVVVVALDLPLARADRDVDPAGAHLTDAARVVDHDPVAALKLQVDERPGSQAGDAARRGVGGFVHAQRPQHAAGSADLRLTGAVLDGVVAAGGRGLALLVLVGLLLLLLFLFFLLLVVVLLLILFLFIFFVGVGILDYSVYFEACGIEEYTPVHQKQC